MKRWLHGLLNDHGRVLAIMTAALIVIETGAVYYGSAQWFIPPLVYAAAIIVLALGGRARLVGKMAFCVIGVVMLAAFSVMAGTAYSSSSTIGSSWGLSVISGWLLAMVLPCFLIITLDAWWLTIVGTLLAFVISYALMPFGTTVVIVTSLVVPIVLSVIAGSFVPALVRRRHRPLVLGSDVLPVHGKDMKLGRHRGMTVVEAEGYGFALIPIRMDRGFAVDDKGRVSYRGRNAYGFLDYWARRAVRRANANVLPVFVDMDDVNEATRRHPRLMSVGGHAIGMASRGIKERGLSSLTAGGSVLVHLSDRERRRLGFAILHDDLRKGNHV